ncbi:MAG: TIGR03936 family radical SAM-associated protein [Bacillota bacterium]
MLLRIKYAVGDELRFLSHLDFLRLFIRVFRRAELPVAYSQGFNPHSKISFGPPLAVGFVSSAEYLDLELTEARPLSEITESLGKNLPKGLSIIGMQEIKGKVTSLMAIIERASYEIKTALIEELTEQELNEIISRFLSRSEIFVTKMTKEGPRLRQIRQGIFLLKAELMAKELVFTAELQQDNRGVVRPEEVITALIETENLAIDGTGLEVRRKGLYAVRENSLLTPLEILSK